eukprot:UN02131
MYSFKISDGEYITKIEVVTDELMEKELTGLTYNKLSITGIQFTTNRRESCSFGKSGKTVPLEELNKGFHIYGLEVNETDKLCEILRVKQERITQSVNYVQVYSDQDHTLLTQMSEKKVCVLQKTENRRTPPFKLQAHEKVICIKCIVKVPEQVCVAIKFVTDEEGQKMNENAVPLPVMNKWLKNNIVDR